MVAYVDFKSLPTIEAIAKELKEFLTHNGVGFFFCYEDDRDKYIGQPKHRICVCYDDTEGRGVYLGTILATQYYIEICLSFRKNIFYKKIEAGLIFMEFLNSDDGFLSNMKTIMRGDFERTTSFLTNEIPKYLEVQIYDLARELLKKKGLEFKQGVIPLKEHRGHK